MTIFIARRTHRWLLKWKKKIKIGTNFLKKYKKI